jgi:hypothetical protein
MSTAFDKSLSNGIAGGHILYNFCDGVKAVWQKGFKP